MNQYTVGNIVVCYFGFMNRALTLDERTTFLNGGGLPVGVGIDQNQALMQWSLNGGAETTLSGASITHDGTGEYHGLITAASEGIYKYEGYSLDGSNAPVAATTIEQFEAVAFR